jgi:hypothetical protein
MDGIDVSHILQVTTSAGYQLIVERIQAMHAAKMRELRNSKLTHDETQALRGFLDGLDRCLAVPETLRAEFERRKGSK